MKMTNFNYSILNKNIDDAFDKTEGWNDTLVKLFCKIYSGNFNNVHPTFSYKKYSGRNMEEKLYLFKKDIVNLQEQGVVIGGCPNF